MPRLASSKQFDALMQAKQETTLGLVKKVTGETANLAEAGAVLCVALIMVMAEALEEGGLDLEGNDGTMFNVPLMDLSAALADLAAAKRAKAVQ